MHRGHTAMLRFEDRQRMFGTEDHRIAAVEPERDSTTRPVALFRHFDGPKSCRLNVDLEPFDRCDEHVPPVRLASQNG